MRLFALPLFCLFLLTASAPAASAALKAGAAVVDVTPTSFPVLVNGGMTSRSASVANTPINARAIVLDDGRERIGIVVVDSCMMPRPLLDEAKTLAAQQTELKPDRILISATHTHTAPAAMGGLGTNADDDYLPVLRAGIAEALVKAESHLEPARVGWAVENAAEFTALRRWVRRPDRVDQDPFGNYTVRANMHAARNPDDVTGESGPEDPDLSMISIQAVDGRPIAVLANFSMHYFSGQVPLAADYFGLFCEGMQKRLQHSDAQKPAFVAIMSHGCSGDIWRRDYRKPAAEQNPFPTIEEYSAKLLDVAMVGYEKISHNADADLAMQESRQVLKYRVPDQQRLQWAQQIVAEMGDRLPKTRPEVYARAQVYLHEKQETEIVVQGLRIGDIGIATTPNETYALTGLKIKGRSPLAKSMVIELANGGDGYIPPPEQHVLGGYNTWAARSAGLEVQAEPIITETALRLLEQVAGKPRRKLQASHGAASRAVVAAKPVAWWRMDDMEGPWAVDSSGHHRDAVYEPGVVFYLEGAVGRRIDDGSNITRAAHFAGGRLRPPHLSHKDSYTISLWAWNGMPNDARPISGWMYSRGRNSGFSALGEHVGIGGTEHGAGRLVLQNEHGVHTGTSTIDRWTWAHVTVTHDANHTKVYLNGELEITAESGAFIDALPVFFGGRCDNDSNWEGRLDEIAVFDRVLTAREIGPIGGR